MELKKFSLKRDVSLFLLIFYGLGNILGAGIYVLIGEISAISGIFTPVSFLIACVTVFFTALSYAELSARFPYSAGEALYAKEAFHSHFLSITIGVLIIFSGILSSAAIVHGFNGYVANFFDLPKLFTTVSLVIVLCVIAIIGIKHSVAVAMVLTFLEIGGLLSVVYVGVEYLPLKEIKYIQYIPSFDISLWYTITLGAFLAFYAFIGFEDMVNIAEEVKNPIQTMPKAIIISLLIATLIYISVSFISILAMPIDVLAKSKAPLADVYRAITHKEPIVLSLIGMFAVVNGVLVQIIMVARVLYGMSMNKWLPNYLNVINPITRTPITATILASLAVIFFTLWLPILTLASFTSFIVFIIFTLMNLALIKIKLKNPNPEGIKTYPMIIPILGIVVNVLMLCLEFFSLL